MPEKVTVAPVLALRLVAGDQLYVLAPLAVIVVDDPRQRLVALLNVMVGNAFTVIERVAVLLHPLALVPVTVYITDTVGVVVIGVPVVAASPVDGDQE